MTIASVARSLGRTIRTEWQACAAAMIVAGWYVVQPEPRVLGLPFVVAWLGALAEVLLGHVAARIVKDGLIARPGLGRYWAVSLLAVAIVALSIGGLALMHASRGVLVAGPAAAAVGALLALPRLDLRGAALCLMIQVVTLWILVDATATLTHGLRLGLYDFQVYLAGGVHALEGAPIYLHHVQTSLPATARSDFFLYPPPLIPLLKLAASRPYEVVARFWVLALVVSGALAFRVLGLAWPWAILFLAFPPLTKGIESGNVLNVALLLFAVGYRTGAALVLGALFKIQNAIPAIWLVRERRWRALAAGVAIVVAVSVATLPLVGVGSWRDWLTGLVYRSESQVQVPLLYGESIARLVSPPAFVLIAAATVLVAFLIGGRRGLAALGVATIVASPSLWPHGFVMAVPALLESDSVALIGLALGIGWGVPGLWGMTLLASLALWSRRGQRRPEGDRAHPFFGRFGPWSAGSGQERPAPRRQAGRPVAA